MSWVHWELQIKLVFYDGFEQSYTSQKIKFYLKFDLKHLQSYNYNFHGSICYQKRPQSHNLWWRFFQAGAFCCRQQRWQVGRSCTVSFGSGGLRTLAQDHGHDHFPSSPAVPLLCLCSCSSCSVQPLLLTTSFCRPLPAVRQRTVCFAFLQGQFCARLVSCRILWQFRWIPELARAE